jgi:L-amino acid N-acyltransferase YncA
MSADRAAAAPDAATTVAIVHMTGEDRPAVEGIYPAGMAARHATFEAMPRTWETFETEDLLVRVGRRSVVADA